MENQPHGHHEKTIKEPFLKKDSPKPKGGFRTLPFIIANEAFEKLASFGLSSNMILYLTKGYGMEAARGANLIFFWSAATNSMPVLGALLADSYVGRYRMITFGCFASLLGMTLLWLTTVIPHAPPSSPCEFSKSCKSAATTLQYLLLYSSFAFTAIGAGGIRSCSLAFGAEQLGRKSNNLKNGRSLESYFNWYYIVISAANIVGMTCVVYVQDAMGWKVGFGIPVILMILSSLSFFLASPFYVKSKPEASFLTGFAQVLVASYKNRSIKVPPLDTNIVYHHKQGTIPQVPNQNLSFLNKACIITNPEEDLTIDGKAYDPWSLCTVDQVEELKTFIRIIPIWSTGVLASVTVSQGSFSVLQATTLDRHITKNFEIPAGSFNAFMVLSLIIWVALYDRIIIPTASKAKGKQVSLSLKQKMGIGILFSSASMAAFAILENIRRETAIEQGYADNPNAVLNISAMWILPHHIFSGIAMGFNAIGQNEFYYRELSKSMSSIASTLYELGYSAGNLMASFIMSAVDEISKRTGKESWVASNINKGRYDYYYWLLSGLCVANFAYYLACCKAYEPRRVESFDVLDIREGLRDGD